MSTFAQWLKHRRREIGLTQEELASAIGYSVASIRKVEESLRLPSMQMTQLLAYHLEVPEADRAAFVKLARSGLAISAGTAYAPGMVYGSDRPLPGVTVPAPPGNLPASSLTRLIGREQITRDSRWLLLDDGVRLLTFTGPPGVGKTSLALEVATALRDPRFGFNQGVFFVSLAPVTEPLFVADTIAGELGLKQAGSSTSFEALISHLYDKRMLLVLDNFEQVIEAAPQVAGLLVDCPGVKALVTSREALNVRGERLLQIPPLEVPDPTSQGSLRAVSRYAAVQLLVQRATAASPDFKLTLENSGAVAEICARVEGLPLAIELVAARTRLLPVEEIVARLDPILKLLVGGPRDLPPRQQTLSAAIEWSHNLLNRDEQILFARLAVFAGGCTHPAADAVCNATVDLLLDVLDGLESLLNKSLLRRELRDGGWRFLMFEAVREYAQEKLDASAKADKLRQVHAEYFLALAEATEPLLAGDQQKAWLDRLEGEHDNLRAALRWSTQHGRLLIAARLAAALGRFWETHGHIDEGRHWLQVVLDKIAAEGEILSPELKARVLMEAGALAATQTSYSDAVSLYEDALALLRQSDDASGRAQVLYRLARLKSEIGDAQGARVAATESLALYRALNDKPGMAHTLNMQGTLNFYGGSEEQGIAFYEESLALYQDVGDRQGATNVLNNLGEVARLRGDYRTASALYRESLEPCRQLGDRVGIAITLNNLGFMALNLGDPGEAKTLFAESLGLCRNLGSLRVSALALYGLASSAGVEGREEVAARLFGAAQALTEKIKTNYAPADRTDFERYLTAIRSTMPASDWSSAWHEGYRMSFNDAIAYALTHVT